MSNSVIAGLVSTFALLVAATVGTSRMGQKSAEEQSVSGFPLSG